MEETLSRLITAFHILHQHQLLDEQGHISVRNPRDPSTFFTSNLPAILVSSKNDLNQWNVVDGSPVSVPYSGCQVVHTVSELSEHYIDSCIYDRFPGVQSIVHSHSLSGIVYGLCRNSGSMLQPSYQMAGFLNTPNPIFDAADHYRALPVDFPHNLLINHKYLGDALARDMDQPSDMDGAADFPSCGASFQRGHGFVTWATNIEDAVYRAIHLRRDADVQSMAMVQRSDTDLDIVYLSDREARDCARTLCRATMFTWPAWVAQVERSGLYYNALRTKVAR
jgi:ribulose-5-phosphate 4-epimerase/fuculose-1-phosphate aldolase